LYRGHAEKVTAVQANRISPPYVWRYVPRACWYAKKPEIIDSRRATVLDALSLSHTLGVMPRDFAAGNVELMSSTWLAVTVAVSVSGDRG
jgi:hypothetical protein